MTCGLAFLETSANPFILSMGDPETATRRLNFAQAFYVGAQIMVWTFIIQYAVNELGLTKEAAQGYNIVAMVIFVSSRFVCTYLLKFVSPGGLLMVLAAGGEPCSRSA